MFFAFFLRNKLAGLSIFLVLVAGLVTAIVLVGRQQFFGSRAGSQYIQLLNQQGQPLPEEGGTPVTDSPNIKIKLNAPPAP